MCRFNIPVFNIGAGGGKAGGRGVGGQLIGLLKVLNQFEEKLFTKKKKKDRKKEKVIHAHSTW